MANPCSRSVWTQVTPTISGKTISRAVTCQPRSRNQMAWRPLPQAISRARPGGTSARLSVSSIAGGFISNRGRIGGETGVDAFLAQPGEYSFAHFAARAGHVAKLADAEHDLEDERAAPRSGIEANLGRGLGH